MSRSLAIILGLDPDPCYRHPWPTRCSCSEGGTHVCRLSDNHPGPCRCDYCLEEATGPDRFMGQGDNDAKS